MPDFDWGALIGQVADVGKGLLNQQFAKKQMRQAASYGRKINRAQQMSSPFAGYGYPLGAGGYVPRGGMSLLGASSPYPVVVPGPVGPSPSGSYTLPSWGDIAQGIGQLFEGPYAQGQAPGDFGGVQSGSSSTADMVPGAGGYYDRCGRWHPRNPPNCPSKIEVLGRDGKPCTFVSQGAPVLYRKDISAVRRVQQVAQLCARALTGGATHRRRGRKKKRGARGRRKVGCRTLTAKQLAAGFGGRAYRK